MGDVDCEVRERAGRATGLIGVFQCLLSGLESNGPAASGMVQRLILELVLAHVLVYNQDNGTCCASLRFASDTKVEGSSSYAGREMNF